MTGTFLWLPGGAKGIQAGENLPDVYSLVKQPVKADVNSNFCVSCLEQMVYVT